MFITEADGTKIPIRRTFRLHRLLPGVFELMEANRYHRYRDGKYPFPNDMVEQGREYLKHDMITRVTEGRRFHAPIGSHPQKILDLGTGVGK